MEFNKELFADLLQQAKGDRSINRFGSEADVDPGYLSRLLRCCVETPPSAAVLAKIAVKAANNVTIEQLLWATGYINWPSLDIVVGDDNGRAPLQGRTPLQDPVGDPPRPTAPNPVASAPWARFPDTAGQLKQAAPDPAPPRQGTPQAGPRALQQRDIARSAGRAPAEAGPSNSGTNHNLEETDDSMVDELLSFCKEMMDRPILQDVFRHMKELSDDKLRRLLKMIKMIDL
jgi:hypothetical protein